MRRDSGSAIFTQIVPSMPKLAFFIEGDMEKEFIENSCKGAMIGRIPNGEGVCISVIAKKISAFYKLYQKSSREFVVILDREGRLQDCSELIAQLKASLAALGIDVTKNWYFGMADRSIENWIVADEKLIQEEFALGAYQYNLESKSGTKLLQELFRKRKGEVYNKRVDGSRLLKRMCLRRASARSASAKVFFESVVKGVTGCWWLVERN